MQNNPYEVLNLQPGVSPDVLKRRYRERLREIHPDLHPEDPEAGDKTRKVVEAYECLSDPEQRAALDQRLREAQAASARKEAQAAAARKEAQAAAARKKTRSRPKKTKSAPSQAPPRPSRRTQSTGRGFSSRNTIIINGQRMEPGEDGNLNVVMGNSHIHISSSTSFSQGDDEGDITMKSGRTSDLIMGDLYIQAHSNVQISGKVMGDVFASPHCQITISGQVLGDIHAEDCNLQVSGMVMGDIFADGGKVKISGLHLGDLL